MKLLYYPESDDGNAYKKIIKSCLIELGIELEPLNKNIIHCLTSTADGVYLQWFENLPHTRLSAFILMLEKILMVLYFKWSKKTIYFVLHNKRSHDSGIASLSNILIKFILKKADKIIILSHTSFLEIKEIIGNTDLFFKCIQNKVFYIPHPNYIDIYPNKNFVSRVQWEIPENYFVIFFCGYIKPYKNIEILIEAFKKANIKKCKLFIAGDVSSEEYKNKVLRKINGDINIITFFSYIPDEEIVGFLNIADIVVLPFDLRSSLNSGSVLLAFSNQKSIIAPQNGTVMDFIQYENLFYSYKYKTEEEHIEYLTNCISKSYRDFVSNPTEFKKKGLQLYQIVKEKNSFSKILDSYKKLFMS